MAGNNNSGRRTKKQEIQAAVEAITAEALAKLARSKVQKYLDKELTFQQTKDLALPIALKDMAQKQDITSAGEALKPILVEFINGKPTDNNPDTK